jgi:putative transposase
MSRNTSRSYASDVSDFEWEFIEPFTRQKPGRGRKRTVDIRAVVNAIFYLNKTGCQWEMLPRDFPDYRHVNYYYNQWRKDGAWDAIQTTVRECARLAEGRESEPSMAIIDSQSVKTDQYGEEQDYDGHKQVKGRKRHIAVDTLGFLLFVVVTCAATRDAEGGQALCDTIQEQVPRVKKVLVDSAYRGQLLEYVARWCRFAVEVVAKSPGQKGFQVQPWRWIVERTFGWFIWYRRLSKDYERTVDSSETMVKIASIRMMLRRLEKSAFPVFYF